jgi:hypothetical protein
MWSGQTMSMLGNKAQGIAMAWLVLHLTGSPLALGSVLIAGSVAGAVFLLLGGAVSDRLAPRATMLLSDLSRALLCGALLLLVVSGRLQLWHLYVTSALFGACGAFFIPAFAAVVPTLVDEGELVRANALVGVSEQVSELMGPAIGGVVVGALGPAGAFAINGASFVAGVLGVIPRPHRPAARAGSGFRRAVAEGLSYVRRRRELVLVLAVISAEALTYTGVFAVGLPALAREAGRGPIGLGLLGAAWGVGQLAGALSAARTGVPRQWGRLLIGITAAEAVAFAVIGLAGGLAVPIAVLAVLGFGVAYASDVALPTWLQRTTPGPLLGRVNSVVSLCQQTLGPVSLAAFAALATSDLALAFLCSGALMLLTALAVGATATARRLVL